MRGAFDRDDVLVIPKRPVFLKSRKADHNKMGQMPNAAVNKMMSEYSFDIVEVIGSSPTNPTNAASLVKAGGAAFLLCREV